MKKKNISAKVPVILLVLAAVCLIASTVGSASAALTYYSEHYSAEVSLKSIGVTLVENGADISYRDYLKDDTWHEATGVLLENMLAEGEKLKLGKKYTEEISVKNSGEIDSYVRVILTKSWWTPDGKKDPTLSPDLINLHLLPGEDWIVDEEASTSERTIIYYTKILPVGESTPILSDTLTIDPAIGTKVIETVTTDDEGYKTITYTYEYNGYRFHIEAEVDAVQTHNVVNAVKSAWGVDVSVDAADGSIILQ